METVVTSIRLAKDKLKQVNKRAKGLKMSRNEYLNKAIDELNKKFEEEEWKASIKIACAAEREARKTDDTYKLISDMAGADLPDDDFDWGAAYGLE